MIIIFGILLCVDKLSHRNALTLGFNFLRKYFRSKKETSYCVSKPTLLICFVATFHSGLATFDTFWSTFQPYLTSLRPLTTSIKVINFDHLPHLFLYFRAFRGHRGLHDVVPAALDIGQGGREGQEGLHQVTHYHLLSRTQTDTPFH